MSMKKTPADTRSYVERLKRGIEDVLQTSRQDVDQVDDVRAKAMFETIAEVLNGLKTACEHFEEGTEAAFQQ